MITIISISTRSYSESDEEVWLWGSLTTLVLVAAGAVTADDGEDAYNEWTSGFYYRIDNDDLIESYLEKALFLNEEEKN